MNQATAVKVAFASMLALVLASCASVEDAATLNEPTLESTATQSISVRIAKGADDTEEVADGTMYAPSTRLEIVDTGDRGMQKVGLRFTNVNIPKGATITSADIHFTADKATSGYTGVSVRGLRDAKPFPTTNGYLSGASTTSERIIWKPEPWTEVSVRDAYSTDDLSNVVQELIEASSWQSGNAMAFVISGGEGDRVAESYERHSSESPLLHIRYTTGSGGGSSSASCLEDVNRTVANPRNGVQYTVKGEGTNAEIDARGKNFFVRNVDENGHKPLELYDNRPGLCFSGGKYDTLVGNDAEWEPDYHYGPAIRAANSPGLVMDNLTVYLGGDAIAFKNGMEGWTVRDSYIRHAGDDAFENDYKFNGTIDDVLVDWAYQGVSCDNKSISRTAGTVTIQDSLFALKNQKGTYNNFKNGTYPANPEHLHVFKWQSATGERNNCKLRLRNNIFYLTQNGGGQSVFDSDQEPTEFVTECEDVTVVYVGGTTFNDAGGRLAALRSRFGADCFKIQQGTVSEKLAFWRAERSKWFDRHSSNSQISYYRNREPQGAN